MASKLLINEYPLIVLPSLAAKIGLNEAIVLQQINYWMSQSRGDGWIYNTIQQWTDQFPFFSESTIKRCFHSLEAQGLIKIEKRSANRLNRVNFYTICFDEVNKLSTKILGSDRAKVLSNAYADTNGPSGQSEPMHGVTLSVSSILQRLPTETTLQPSHEKAVSSKIDTGTRSNFGYVDSDLLGACPPDESSAAQCNDENADNGLSPTHHPQVTPRPPLPSPKAKQSRKPKDKTGLKFGIAYNKARKEHSLPNGQLYVYRGRSVCQKFVKEAGISEDDAIARIGRLFDDKWSSTVDFPPKMIFTKWDDWTPSDGLDWKWINSTNSKYRQPLHQNDLFALVDHMKAKHGAETMNVIKRTWNPYGDEESPK